jgi:hypothetical protein
MRHLLAELGDPFFGLGGSHFCSQRGGFFARRRGENAMRLGDMIWHNTIDLTMRLYTDVDQLSLAAEVAKLPKFVPSLGESVSAPSQLRA